MDNINPNAPNQFYLLITPDYVLTKTVKICFSIERFLKCEQKSGFKEGYLFCPLTSAYIFTMGTFLSPTKRYLLSPFVESVDAIPKMKTKSQIQLKRQLCESHLSVTPFFGRHQVVTYNMDLFQLSVHFHFFFISSYLGIEYALNVYL